MDVLRSNQQLGVAEDVIRRNK